MPLLSLDRVSAGYGKLSVLHDVSLRVESGEIVAVVGLNGAGKSTLLGAISGLVSSTAGAIVFDGQNLKGASTRKRMRAGLVHVLEGHRVIPSLTIEENIQLAMMHLPRAVRTERLQEALDAFPDLAPKRQDQASTLSGGQQQMLVVAQGMVRHPKLLLLDEPSAGLAPVLIDRVLGVAKMLAARGTAVLLVEQAVEKALSVANRVYALAHGEVVLDADVETARKPGVLERAYLGTADA